MQITKSSTNCQTDSFFNLLSPVNNHCTIVVSKFTYNLPTPYHNLNRKWENTQYDLSTQNTQEESKIEKQRRYWENSNIQESSITLKYSDPYDNEYKYVYFLIKE